MVYLIGLQLWYRLNGDTQRTAGVAILVVGLMLVGLHILALMVGALVQYYRGAHERACATARAAFIVAMLGVAISFLNGVVVQL